MSNTSVNFKMGKLLPLTDQSFEIKEVDNQMCFYIQGKSDKRDEYSLEFTSFITREQLLEFELNEHIDFIRYVDDSDIVFGKNGIYDLNTEIKMDIMRYLPNSFILNISFKDREDLVGNLELDFKLQS